MAKDYKHRRPKEQRCSPCWVWFVSGILVGVFSAFLFNLSGSADLSSLSMPPLLGERGQPTRDTRDVKRDTQPERKPQYEFYNLLPEQEVLVPESQLREQTPAPVKPTPPPPPAPSGKRFVVQAGAFQQSTEADALKARLILNGFSANIAKVTIKGTAWYRVRIGPTDSLESARTIRSRLRKQGHDGVVLQLK